MTSATLTNYLKISKKFQSKVSSVSIPEVNWKIVCGIVFIICLPLLFFYAWQIVSLTEGSYLISSYEKQINQLMAENKNLQVSFAENSFLGEALIKIQNLNFEKVTSVKYIQLPDNVVVSAR